jgi:hypothetical protein
MMKVVILNLNIIPKDITTNECAITKITKQVNKNTNKNKINFPILIEIKLYANIIFFL